MGYYWYYDDNTAAVMTGANAQPVWGGVIQRQDGYEGYNAQFGVPNSVARYHVHFRAAGTLAVTVRYFGGGGGQGNNVMRFDGNGNGGDPATRKDLTNLAGWLNNNGYPNHAQLMTNLAAAIPAARLPNGEIA